MGRLIIVDATGNHRATIAVEGPRGGHSIVALHNVTRIAVRGESVWQEDAPWPRCVKTLLVSLNFDPGTSGRTRLHRIRGGLAQEHP